jgi:hypothetical protein
MVWDAMDAMQFNAMQFNAMQFNAMQERKTEREKERKKERKKERQERRKVYTYPPSPPFLPLTLYRQFSSFGSSRIRRTRKGPDLICGWSGGDCRYDMYTVLAG